MNAGPTKPMPHSLDAERALLGGFLQRPDKLDSIKIRLSDLHAPHHRELLALMRTMRAEGKPIDSVTIPEHVAKSGDAGKFGGLAYVLDLEQHCPSPQALPHYAMTVSEAALRRKIIQAASMAMGKSYDGSASPDEVLGELVVALRGLHGDADSGKWRSLHSLIGDSVEEIQERKDLGKAKGYGLGLRDLDRVAMLAPGELTFLAARPAMGKTAMMIHICDTVAWAEKVPVGVFSIEMTGTSLAERLLVKHAQLDGSAIRHGHVSDRDMQTARDFVPVYEDLPFFVDDRSSLTIADVVAQSLALQAQCGQLGLIAVDYIQIVKADEKAGETRARALTKAAYGLQALAKDLGCPVLALSQLSRKCEERQNKRPLMSDLKESGGIEEAADQVLFLYRDEYYNPNTQIPGITEVIIGKGRHGPTGTVPVSWDGPSMSFGDLDDVDIEKFKRFARAL